jgi:hypothetical protein
MIRLINRDRTGRIYYLLRKYDFNIQNALATGAVPGNGTITVPSPTGTTVSIVWAFDQGVVGAAGIVSVNGTSEFYNDPNGVWCRQY